MALEEDLAARMRAVTGLSAILGREKAAVSWFETPRELFARQAAAGQSQRCLLLTPVIPGPIWTHEGRNTLSNPSVQFESWSTDPDEATAMKRLVTEEMERVDRVTMGGTLFLPPGMLEREFADTDMIGAITDQGGTKVYRWLQEYRFYCQPVT